MATRGSLSRPVARQLRRETRQDSWRAASGSWSQILPSVQAAVSCTCTTGSFIREMSTAILCGWVCVCGGVSEWVSGWVSEWVREWVREWVSEWVCVCGGVSEWVSEGVGE